LMEKLAIEGGAPVRDKPYPPWPWFWEEEKQAVREVLDSGKVNYWTGTKGMEFQKRFAEYCNVKNCIIVNSGTSALHVALAAAQVGPGDEVIVPSYTFIATAAACLHQTAVPVFADIDPKTYNLDPESVKKKITKRTRAMIPVHLHGHPAEMDPIMELAEENDLVVIEDAAQAHGAEYKGRKIGSIGHLASFSFCQDKIFTTGGEGGAVTTNDDEMAEIARSFKDHGYWEEEHRSLLEMEALHTYIHHRMGYNYRMTEMQAAVGLVALKRLDGWVEKRRENAHYLSEHLKEIPQVDPPYEAPYVKHSFYKYAATINPQKLRCTRDQFIEALKKEGIPSHPGVPPENYREEVFQKMVGFGRSQAPFARPWYTGKLSYKGTLCPNARKLGAKTFWLLVHPTVQQSDLDDAIAAIKKVCEAYAK